MTCQEFQRVLPELEGGRSLEADAHLRMCSRCWDLVSDLDAITRQAQSLQASEDPSPRVWNSIEITLRQEGLIHEPQPDRAASRRTNWRLTWLAPVMAALLVVSGLLLRQHRDWLVPRTTATNVDPTPHAPSPAVGDEAQLLRVVAASAPALRDGYANNLRAVDSYIQDAELSARNNPNDEIAQEYLTNAYEERAMVYEIGMARSLP